jgi:hypothetical protein
MAISVVRELDHGIDLSCAAPYKPVNQMVAEQAREQREGANES